MRIEDLRQRTASEEAELARLGVKEVIIEDTEYEEDEEDSVEKDLTEALALLDSFVEQLGFILQTRKKRLSIMQEQELTELVAETEQFLDQWNWVS